ncbi:aldehyde dehydrogenase family protein [Kineosporia sp. A_224]|uniref:aldehyde dehydrogenase family protein n=1 Tax=Kineosporia sp. A_224 TaxID=1962180 RepID=UPI000B4B45EF|nr:aldehyde dehydrogenase family protein [Kineosporia sp. A_224]
MTTNTTTRTTSADAPGTAGTTVAGDEEFARNLVDGRWRFPAAPYEFEIRSPQDSRVVACVPLSSRFDVDAALQAGARAAQAWAADPAVRVRLVAQAVADLDRLAVPVAEVVATETGLDLADAVEQVRTGVRWARHRVALAAVDDAGPPAVEPPGVAGVAGVVLGWGAPFLEAVSGILPLLLQGRTVVVKPSLRAPLSAVVLAHRLVAAGLPEGVLGVVQGTGTDVGAALVGRRDLAVLHVRGGGRTLDLAGRAVATTGVPLHPLRAGGNVLLSGRDADPALVAATVAAGLRLHNASGPAAVPWLVVHADTAGPVVDALVAAASATRPVPLPTEPVRDRALAAVRTLGRLGGRVLTGGAVPDDVAHRMGWLVPATVVTVGAVGSRLGPRSDDDPWREPLGPVVAVATWRTSDDLADAFSRSRFRDGIGWVHQVGDDAAAALTGVVRQARGTDHGVDADDLPAAWTTGCGGVR